MGNPPSPGTVGVGADADPPTLHAVQSGSGPPVVLLHGVAGSHRVFDLLAPFLEPHRTVVRVDLLGYGNSPTPVGRYTPRRHVESVRATLRQAGIRGPVDVVGLSMGAILALELAATWPDEVASLVGIGFPYYATEAAARAGLAHNPWTRLAVRHPRMAPMVLRPVWFAGRHALRVMPRGALYTREMMADALLARPVAFESTVRNSMVRHRTDPALAAGGDRPRLFLHGSEDRWVAPGDVARALAPYPRSRLHVVDGGVHNLAVAAPGPTARLILEALAP
jgi:pimeloyl-ACP methyl ester carboxylesterase